MSDAAESHTFNADEFTLGALHERLNACAEDMSVRIRMNQAVHGLCAGFDRPLSISIEGNVGDFAFLMSDRADFEVQGNAGVGCCHSLSSGSTLIRGRAGDSLGAFARGGFIAVHGTAGRRAGLRLVGADVFVRSTVGDEAGYGMRGGTLVLGNGAGEQVGLGMSGGLIYIRGDVKSVADSARQVRMKDAESLRLSLFLARAGIKSAGAEFKVYRARQESK